MKSLEAILKKALLDKTFFAKAFFNIELTPKQKEALLLGGQVQIKVCGRRFGKSLVTLIDVVHECLRKPNCTWYIVAPTIDQAKIYFDELEEKGNDLLQQFIIERLRSPFPEVTFVNKSKMLARSVARDGRYLRGKGADGVAITEAAFINDNIYYQVIRAMVLERRGRVRLETTPAGHNYIYELFNLGLNDKSGYYKSFHATVYDNERLAREEIEQIRKEVPEIAWRQEYLAEFVDDDTFLFPWSLLQGVYDDYSPEGTPYKNHRYTIGVDLAKYRDYTVIVVLDITRRPYRIAEHHRYQGAMYTDIASHVNELQQKYKARVYLDATGVGDPVAEQIRNCEPFVFSQKTKAELIRNLSVVIQRKEILLPFEWTALRDELRYFQAIPRGDNFKFEAPSGKHDDCVIALALAVWGAREHQPRVSVITTAGIPRTAAQRFRGY